MSLRQRDLVKAVLLASGIGVIFIFGMFLVINAFADENDSAVGLTITIKEGSLPGLDDGGYTQAHIPADRTDANNPVMISYCAACFTHVYFKSGDTVGCIFTLPIGGGRHCYEGSRDDRSCGFFTEGTAIYGVASSCTSAGVDECGGTLCY